MADFTQWARRNAWALVAIPVLAAGVVGAVALETDPRILIGAAASDVPDQVVAAGETIEIDGITFGPLEFQVSDSLVDGDQPPNSQIVLAAISVSGGKEGLTCSNLAVVSEKTGTLWLETTTELGLYDLPDNVSSWCSSKPEPVVIAGFFAMPATAEGPWVVELEVEQFSDEAVKRQTLRFVAD